MLLSRPMLRHSSARARHGGIFGVSWVTVFWTTRRDDRRARGVEEHSR